jgi:cytochrome c oxidase assembly protein subunit 15
VVAGSTLALLIAGGLVTSNDAALAVPDWPLSWGRLVPPLEGGIRFEFAHRVLALLVFLLTGVLAWRTQVRRTLAWSGFATVLAQALLGGALVRFVDPKSLAIAHASLAQICFALTVAVAFAESMPDWRGWLAIAVIFAQAVLGAAVRHGAAPVEWHMAGAVAAAGVAMWIALAAVIRHLDSGKIPRPALALLGITALQIFSGIGAYAVRAAAVDDPQPMPLTVWTTVAHVALGALMLGAAIVLATGLEGDALPVSSRDPSDTPVPRPPH